MTEARGTTHTSAAAMAACQADRRLSADAQKLPCTYAHHAYPHDINRCCLHSQPAAGDEKFHATGEVEDAFKMTHLRMVYFSRDPSTTNQAENARQSASAHHGGSHRPSFIVGGRHGSRSVGNPYFTHTFEALTAKVSVTSRRQNSLR